jgi:hypothetical protein
MKKTNTFKFLGMLAVAAGLFLASCSKEGPAGPKGDTGATGATGASGPQAKTFDFSLTYNVGDSLKTYTMTGSSATDVALTYYKFSDNSYMQLPYFSPDGSGFYIIPYFYPANGNLDVEIPKRISTAATINIRSVLIKSSAKVAGLDYSNYNAVKAYYHLAD